MAMPSSFKIDGLGALSKVKADFKENRRVKCTINNSNVLTIQWNLHKTDTIGEKPFGCYREMFIVERFQLPNTVGQFVLQKILGGLLTAL